MFDVRCYVVMVLWGYDVMVLCRYVVMSLWGYDELEEKTTI